jgi:hypothetical protein
MVLVVGYDVIMLSQTVTVYGVSGRLGGDNVVTHNCLWC